jgi:hypothetical protein
MLPADAGHKRNFLNETIANYVDRRVPEVQKANGTLDENRLRCNMLSSMPLCFNLFGFLEAHPAATARALSQTFQIDIAEVLKIEVESVPTKALGDRTAFDALVRYRRSDGREGFIGIETKYTEPFSQKEYCRDEYLRRTDDQKVFKPGAAERLKGRKTNQLWRNTMLALCTRADERNCGECFVGVLSCQDDRGALDAVAGLRNELCDPRILCVSTYERLIDICVTEESLETWAVAFRQRYLDLSPIQSAMHAKD